MLWVKTTFVAQRESSAMVCLRPLRCFCSMCWCGQVTETEREDLEESEKVQYWVERLCQTRLEQISSVENDSPEVNVQTR